MGVSSIVAAYSLFKLGPTLPRLDLTRQGVSDLLISVLRLRQLNRIFTINLHAFWSNVVGNRFSKLMHHDLRHDLAFEQHSYRHSFISGNTEQPKAPVVIALNQTQRQLKAPTRHGFSLALSRFKVLYRSHGTCP